MNQANLDWLIGRTAALNGQDMGKVVGWYAQPQYNWTNGLPTGMKIVVVIHAGSRVFERDLSNLTVL